MKRSEMFYKMAWHLFLVGFLVYAAVGGWWLLYPYNPITVKSITIENPGKKVVAGDILTYKISYEKHMDIPGMLTRKLVNNFKIDMAESVVTAPTGIDSDNVRIRVPQYADAGTYYLWWSVTYQVNPIRQITKSYASEKFEVVK